MSETQGETAIHVILMDGRDWHEFDVPTSKAIFRDAGALAAKTIVFLNAPSYPETMHLVRHMIFCLVVALSANSVAMAANDVGHQTHCVDAFDGVPPDFTAGDGHEHTHNHDGIGAQHTAPDHDHDTCMIHSCPALSAEIFKLGKPADTFLTKLNWHEQPLLALELADGLKRPPEILITPR